MKETEKIEIMHFSQEGYVEDGKALYETGKKMTALADKVADEGYDAVFLMGVGGTWDELMQLEYLMNKFGDLVGERGHLLAGLVERLTVLEIALLVEMHDLDLLGFLHLSLLSGVVSTSPMPTGIKTRLHSVTLSRFGLKRID